MADRKRKLLASASVEGQSPSLKKARTQVFSEEEVESVISYQKEKILLRIEELNREVRTLQGREDRVEELEREYRALTESVSRHWMQLQTNLHLLVQQLPQPDGDEMDTTEDGEEKETLAEALKNAVESTLVSSTKQTKKTIPAEQEEKELHTKMEKSARKAHSILCRIVTAIEAERERNSALHARLQELSSSGGVAEEIAAKHKETLAHNGRLQEELDTLQAAFARLGTQHSEWRARATALAEDLSTRTSERDEFEASLAIAERKVDKLELALKAAGVAAAAAAGGDSSPLPGPKSGAAFPAVKHTAKMPPKKAAAAAATAIEKNSAEQAQLEEEVKGLRHSVGELEVVSKKREEDLQDLQEQREHLLREITHVKFQSVVTDEAVYKSPIHQELVKRFQTLQLDLRQAHSQLTQERMNLQRLDEITKDEKEKTRLVHREELKKVQQEMDSVQESLSRMTQERNSISHHMSVARAQKPSKRTLAELQRLADSQETQVKALTKECARLRGEWEAKDGAEAEEELIAEIDSIGEELRKMQEQNARLAKQMAEKDDANAQLMSERIQGKMQEGLLKKEAQLEQQRAAVLDEKVQQLERLAAQKDAVAKNLADQLAKVKESLRSVTASYDATRQQLRDALSSSTELKAQTTQLKSAQGEMKAKADEQLSLLEQDARRTKKLEEENLTLKKRLERYSKPKSEDYLEEVLIDYKQMLNCPICKERRKTTVIAKCYHVFCRDCIERNLNLRKRRCPACQQPFSVDDVKEIWLNFSA